MSSPSTLGAHAIRRRFLDFFKDRKHQEVPSAPLVPQNDPTLLFVNAGMVPFKDLFLGRENRGYERATSAQRCLRAGGKHNDLDNVGFTPRHHTLFEMLGNFSFGDYFKKEAIGWSWEFLTEVMGIDPKRLCVSVYSGEGEAASADEEAYQMWTEIIAPERIYRCSAKDNFWSMGNTGPCGPCSEIHIFREGDAPPDAFKEGAYGPSFEEDKYLELWNLVFMQYEKQESGELVALPKPSIDTGAGLERLAAVAAGVQSNYETDLLSPLVRCAKGLAGVQGPQGQQESAFQVIADHARATAFLVADGVFPDKGGRSYVLRRIMRRAIRYGTTVGLDDAFFHTVCLEVVSQFQDAYPELSRARATIEEVVGTEEENFRRTLNRGLRRLEGELSALDSECKIFPVPVAAELYDTYGFPIDLSGVIAKERGLSLDEKAVEEEVHRRQSGQEGFVGQGSGVADHYFAVESGLSGEQAFHGYKQTEHEGAKVLAIVVDGVSVPKASAGQSLEVVLDATSFYAESGGQVGDSGALEAQGLRVEVEDTAKPTGRWHFHRGTLKEGELAVGASLRAVVDPERRAAIARNHSATHLVHLALREVLGPHVIQKGSLVSADRFRFDFSHSKPLSSQERQRIEARVAELSLGNQASHTEEMSLDQAKEAGAIGLFGEKYGSSVRVVRIGGESLELCGGTHVKHAGDIGLFCIVHETGIAQGVRRIEAVTGLAALARYQMLDEKMQQLCAALHAGGSHEIQDKLEKLQSDYKAKSQEVDRLAQKLATGGGDAASETQEIGGIKLLVKEIAQAEAKVLRGAADTLRDRLGSGVVALGTANEGKATLLIAATKDLKGKVHAGKLVAAIAPLVGGKGGGKPELGQAGGPGVEGLSGALAKVPELLQAQLEA